MSVGGFRVIAVVALLAGAFLHRPAPALAQTIDVEVADPRIGPPDNSGNVNSGTAHIAANGRFVTFFCYAANVVANDTNAAADVFVLDRQTWLVARVSVSSSGAQADGASLYPRISGTGRWVAFQSVATHLVPNDTNGQPDIYLHDRATRITSRVSYSSQGAQANGACAEPAISTDGRYVAFSSTASNLVASDVNASGDVFVRDLLLATTTRVSVNLLGQSPNNYSQDPAISADGRCVAFESLASDLVPNDTNTNWDIFVRDRAANVTERVSVANDGTQANGFCTDPSISGDGRYVTFLSSATNLVPNDTNAKWDVFLHDRQTHATTRVSTGNNDVQGNAPTTSGEISDDGRSVLFRGFSTNLIPGDTNNKADVFVRNLATGIVTRVSVNEANQQGNDNSYDGALSKDGGEAVFVSQATNLDPGAADPQVYRVFVRGAVPTRLGDMNGDGRVDGQDVTPFVALLLNPPTDLIQLARLDIDGNGVVDSIDTLGFTRLVLGLPAFPRGDLTLDGLVDGQDIARYVALRQTAPSDVRLDIDANGIIDAADTAALIRKLLGNP